ncbi:MAG: helix-turn-helix transcriptional regulator, partial [Sphingopyxis sp.]|nr:helix-turn-helix transcriptional regulator [Sphingopyxis sp.]
MTWPGFDSLGIMMIENDLFPQRESFGDRLRDLRRARGMGQSQLAEAMAVSCPTVSGWEKGRMHPRHDRLDALAAFLG